MQGSNAMLRGLAPPNHPLLSPGFELKGLIETVVAIPVRRAGAWDEGKPEGR